MAVGKLSLEALINKVFPFLGKKRIETVLPARQGEDCAALDLSGDLVVLSTDPITGASDDAGYLAVIVSCNDILSNGAEPVAILLTILLKETEDEKTVERLMRAAHRGAKEMQVEIIGGHTEFTPGLNQNILSVTAVGRVAKAKLLRSQDIEPGDDLILTKGAGIEGTAILCADYPDQVRRILGQTHYDEGLAMLEKISIGPEARIARQASVHAMHDVTEGGVFGACYEMASASGIGLTLNEEDIIIPQATAKLCQSLRINPYRLISSGALLIAGPDGGDLVARLKAENIDAAIIGQFTEGHILLSQECQTKALDPPQGDELWLAKQRLDS